jgi:hypothetical protein
MSQQTTGTPRELEAHLIARAWKDEAFKQELLSNPTAVVERELRELSPGATLPQYVQIHVLEETPTTRYLVLPPRPSAVADAAQLSDQELAQVAGSGVKIEIQTPNTYCWTGGGCYMA